MVYDILEVDTLWPEHRPSQFLYNSGAKSFKIIQIGKGRRKLVAYFENWESVRKVIAIPQVFHPFGLKLKWCQHSTPNLRKLPKTKNFTGRNPGQASKAQLKKNDKKSLNPAPKTGNKSKNPELQKKKRKEEVVIPTRRF